MDPVRFYIVLAGREKITGMAEVTKHGELMMYVTDKDRPLLLDIVMSCNIKNATLSFDLEKARPWVKPSAEVRDILAAGKKEEASLEPSSDSIGMSMHFNDADPVAVCLVRGCKMHFHGDSRNGAMAAWSTHVSEAHQADWGD